jgi:hypothetical protein
MPTTNGIDASQEFRYSNTKIGGSFNGRTTDSDSVNLGSNPGPPARDFKGVSNNPFFYGLR